MTTTSEPLAFASIATVASLRSGVLVRVSGALSHRCPVRDEEDRGTVTIEWATTDVTLELRALADYLRRWAGWRATHEDMCAVIRVHASASGVDVRRVTYEAEQDGLRVAVTAEGGREEMAS